MKRCVVCREEKELSEYYVHPKHGGAFPKCKQCTNKINVMTVRKRKATAFIKQYSPLIKAYKELPLAVAIRSLLVKLKAKEITIFGVVFILKQLVGAE